jgi:hypothetical protein
MLYPFELRARPASVSHRSDASKECQPVARDTGLFGISFIAYRVELARKANVAPRSLNSSEFGRQEIGEEPWRIVHLSWPASHPTFCVGKQEL